MSPEPLCPECKKPSSWTYDGKSHALCPGCARTAANEHAESCLKNMSKWFKGKDQSFLGLFNIIALGAFIHATQYRLNHSDRSIKESWDAFTNSDSNDCYNHDASDLYDMLVRGHFADVNAPHLCEHLRKIHDASFHGQWAIDLTPKAVALEPRDLESVVISEGEITEDPGSVVEKYGEAIAKTLNNGTAMRYFSDPTRANVLTSTQGEKQ